MILIKTETPVAAAVTALSKQSALCNSLFWSNWA